jgi:hypothetical protein
MNIIELYKKLLFSQIIKIAVLEKGKGDFLTNVDISNYSIYENKDFILLIKLPNIKEIRFCSQKYKLELKRIITSDSKPDGSLLNIKKDFNRISKNFYSHPESGNGILLNVYSEIKYIKSDEDLNQYFSEEIFDLPTICYLPEALKQYGEITSKFYSDLNKYFNFLYYDIYQEIADTIDSLLNELAGSVPNGQKIETTFTVPELALLFRLLNDSMKLKPDNKIDLYRMVARNFTSKRRDNLSVDSIKNNYENPDPKAKSNIEELLKQMQRRLLRL